jgi:hypothetical protein
LLVTISVEICAGAIALTGFGCRVVRTDNSAKLGSDRRQIDDASPASFTHRRHDSLGENERRCEVRRNQLIPVLLGDPIQRLWPGDAGVIDENVDAAERRDRRLAQAPEILAA